MNIKQMRDARVDLKARGSKILEAAKTDDRDLSADELEKLDAITAELKDVDGKIEAEERRLDLERVLAPDPVIDPVATAALAANIGTHPAGAPPGETCGYHNIGEFARDVHMAFGPKRVQTERLLATSMLAAPSNVHVEAGADEGYMVPPAFRSEIWEVVAADESDNLLNMIDMEPTQGNSVGLAADETTPWGATGVQARWRAENAQMTADKLDTDTRQIRLHEMYAFVNASEELLEDAPRLNARLSRKAPEAIRYKANEAIMFGSGAGQPLGWMNAGALVTVTKESGQAAATINENNVAKMFSRLLASSISRSIFLVNSDIIPQLLTMTIGNQPVWLSPQGMASSPGGTLMGRPVVPTEHCQTLGTVGDIQLVDPKGYYGARKQSGITFAESVHLYFDFNVKAFRWTFRLAGQPFLSAPVSPAKGTNTKSHFVALETRG